MALYVHFSLIIVIIILVRTIRHGHGEDRDPPDRGLHLQGHKYSRLLSRRERRSVLQLQGEQDPLLRQGDAPEPCVNNLSLHKWYNGVFFL